MLDRFPSLSPGSHSVMPHPVAAIPAALAERTSSVAVVGLGYVGLPLAVCLAQRFAVIGFDIDASRLEALRAGRDTSAGIEAERLARCGIDFTADPTALERAG